MGPSATTRSIIGGGHNGLVSAAYLARAGMKTLVLEQRHVLGGAAVTEELFPGFRFRSSRTSSRCSGPRSSASSSCRATASTSCRSTGRSRRSGRATARSRRWRRLPLAGQRPRPDDPRAAPLVDDRRRGVRGIRPAHGRDGPLHQADPRDHAARPDLARPAPAAAAGRPARTLPAAAGAPAGGLRPADDDERGRLPRPVVRDGSAQGDDERVGDHRDVPGRPLARHGVRPAPPLHGRDRRRVPGVGHPEGRHRRRSRTRSRRRRGRSARRSGPRRRSRGSSSKNGRATGVVLEDPARRSRRPTSSRRSTRAGRSSSLLEPGTLDAEFEEEVRRFKFRGSSGKVNLAVDRLPDFTCLPGRRRAPPRRDLVLPVARRDGAGLRRREVRPVQRRSRTST